MLYLISSIEYHNGFFLLLALIFVLAYEVINGFHDTANAVATVIHTHSLNSKIAVSMSGIFNFLGVLMGGLSVAYTIVHLLPNDLLLNINSSQGLIMIFSILLAAIIWNLGTWYFGLPTSSSHTLIGAIIGVGLTNSLIKNNSIIENINISNLIEVFSSLMISPFIGFIIGGFIIFLLRLCIKNKITNLKINLTPEEMKKKEGKITPPFWIRIALIFSSAGVSFSHGANDGQKGIGLIMLVLMGTAPSNFIVNMDANVQEISSTRDAINNFKQYYIQNKKFLTENIEDSNINFYLQKDKNCNPKKELISFSEIEILNQINHSLNILKDLNSYSNLNSEEKLYIRSLLMKVSGIIDKIEKNYELPNTNKKKLKNLKKDILHTVEYAPKWIIISVALAISIGTMAGWKRVTTTIIKKIGKRSMTYAQGLSAQLTSAFSIGVASYTGMPVSTTHVLSSAVVGTMFFDGNKIQEKTIKNIILAWVLTFPISIFMSGIIYFLFLEIKNF